MPQLYLGLISGTSVDGVDAVLADLADARRPRILAALTHPMDSGLRDALLGFSAGASGTGPGPFGELDHRVGALFAEAAIRVLREAGVDAADVTAIGSHGQNVHHAPDGPYPYSLQIGDPSLIAARTGITTVADFRRRDVALGGQGAPLVPAFHRGLFQSDAEHRCVVNIGGIANVTVLPRVGDVTGFDTGPGNALMDLWAERHLGQPFDAGGRWAAGAEVIDALLQHLLDDPYFERPPPKSTGREHFHLDWLRRRLDRLAPAPDPARVQRTLCALTARTIADAIEQHAPACERVLLCGGGTHNATLRQHLADTLPSRPVEDTAAYGLPPDWVEACAFAWLAMRTLAGLSGNLPSVTGARESAVLGGVYAGARETGRPNR